MMAAWANYAVYGARKVWLTALMASADRFDRLGVGSGRRVSTQWH